MENHEIFNQAIEKFNGDGIIKTSGVETYLLEMNESYQAAYNIIGSV